MYNYNYMRQPLQPSLDPSYGLLKGRPVSSVDEARAAHIDFDGTISIFPDFANKKIYTKQINIDGSLSFYCYSLSETQEPTSEYITKDQLKQILNQFKEELNATSAKGGVENEQPTSKSNAEFNF